jgi:hypothetical protein
MKVGIFFKSGPEKPWCRKIQPGRIRARIFRLQKISMKKHGSTVGIYLFLIVLVKSILTTALQSFNATHKTFHFLSYKWPWLNFFRIEC